MKRYYFGGILLGLVVPYLGLFFGLQVSTTLGNILAWPLLLVAAVSATPIGMFSGLHWLFAITLSCAFWTSVLFTIKTLRQR
jgi:hypothetical protein